jgi:hypothetical protein
MCAPDGAPVASLRDRDGDTTGTTAAARAAAAGEIADALDACGVPAETATRILDPARPELDQPG